MIHKINWNEIRSNMGFCDSIPQAIENLISSNAEIRENAYWKLDNHIVVQGTLYEGAFYVIPFLLNYIYNDIENGKKEIYNLLYEIANGWSDYNDYVEFKYSEYENIMYFIPDKNNGVKLPLQLACRNAILSAWDVLKKELYDDSSDCRSIVLDIIFIYQEYSHILQMYLKDIIDSEQSQFAKYAMEYYNEITLKSNSANKLPTT